MVEPALTPEEAKHFAHQAFLEHMERVHRQAWASLVGLSHYADWVFDWMRADGVSLAQISCLPAIRAEDLERVERSKGRALLPFELSELHAAVQSRAVGREW